MSAPDRVVVAGDWHGNSAFATAVIGELDRLLPSEERRIVLHAGDFGIWPGAHGHSYLVDIETALAEVDAELWFVDGNHEDHWQLRDLATRARIDPSAPARVPIGDRISWLPRGHRWTWHGRTWMALGGAASVDKPVRARGTSWWPEELLSEADVWTAVEPGPVDIMLTHDAPASVPLNLPRPAPAWWDLRTADEHRRTVQAVVDEVRPSWLIHGHYHLSAEQTVRMAHGPVQVTSLDSDQALSGNFRVLDVQDMRWMSAVSS